MSTTCPAQLRWRGVSFDSSVKLNKFIYDPNRSSGKAVFDAAKGSFRFTTGAQGGGGTHQIKTPYGTLGIRG